MDGAPERKFPRVSSEVPLEQVLRITQSLRENFKDTPACAVLLELKSDHERVLRILYAATGEELASALEELDSASTITITQTVPLPPSFFDLPKDKRHDMLRKRYWSSSTPSAKSVLVQSVEPI